MINVIERCLPKPFLIILFHKVKLYVKKLSMDLNKKKLLFLEIFK